MKLLLPLTILFVLVAGSSLFAAEQGINETGKAFVKAFQANDLEAVVALYAPDAELFPPDEMQAKGTDAIRANYKGLFDHFTIQNIDIVEAEHETHGDISMSWGLFKMTMMPKGGGDPVHMEGRFSDISMKVNGKWLYKVDHASVPFQPAPGQTNSTK
ncbi:MAG: hypothetical protein C5B54_00335 [Acidobacteria bacterium]|nr:MAG: hypothetical protein C5B54_00335 [Acidobacteriota bacterium]